MRQVMEKLPPSAKASAGLVWVNVLEEDDAKAAQAAAAQLQHPCLTHFHDPGQLAAQEMATTLGGAGRFAWDVYLVFAADAAWDGGPPQPADWAHQLDRSAWAPAERLRKGEALVETLQKMLACA